MPASELIASLAKRPSRPPRTSKPRVCRSCQRCRGKALCDSIDASAFSGGSPAVRARCSIILDTALRPAGSLATPPAGVLAVTIRASRP